MKKYYVGMDLGGTNIKLAIFDEGLAKAGESRLDTEKEYGSQHVLERMYEGITGLLEETGISVSEVEAMGIGVPGLMDIKAGVSRFSPNLPDWENVPVSSWLGERLGIPVYIDNDARVNLYGEWYFGAGKGMKNLMMLTLGTGLGAAYIVDGHMLYGAGGSANEFGHMNMFREGRPCNCGSSGCLGRYVSAVGMVNTLREKIGEGRTSIITDWVGGDYSKVTADMLSEAYDKGDRTAIETLEETGELLGFALGTAMNLLNPEMIIIGGGMSQAGERLLCSTRKTVEAHSLKLARDACRIVTARLGDAAGMEGAAAYARLRHEDVTAR